jgi:hypothetical protein
MSLFDDKHLPLLQFVISLLERVRKPQLEFVIRFNKPARVAYPPDSQPSLMSLNLFENLNARVPILKGLPEHRLA